MIIVPMFDMDDRQFIIMSEIFLMPLDMNLDIMTFKYCELYDEFLIRKLW